MSYRIYVYKENGDSFQLFGNNEYPVKCIDVLRAQGCDIDEDGCFSKFEIKDVQPFINAIEDYIKEQEEYNINYGLSSIYNFEKSFTDSIFPLTYRAISVVENGYAFVSYNFVKFFSDELEPENIFNYKIKNGKHIFISGS